MKNSISDLKNKALESLKNSSKNSQSVNNKTILIELLKRESFDRQVLPIVATEYYFTEVVKTAEATEEEFEAKRVSFRNSLDTLISNFNSPEKISRDESIRGKKLVESNNSYQIV